MVFYSNAARTAMARCISGEGGRLDRELNYRMWFNESPQLADWTEATRHLNRVDPVLGKVIKGVGICTLRPRRDYFVVLCKSIYSQQISTKVAATLFGRFCRMFPNGRPTPTLVMQRLSEGDDDALRACGLSRQKKSYLLDLAGHFADGRVPTRKLSRMEDEEIIQALVGIKGVGRWTAEMFLIFVLNRTDVLPVDDLGLREGMRDVYGMRDRPTVAQMREIAEKWRPYRSIATWYIWRRGSGGV